MAKLRTLNPVAKFVRNLLSPRRPIKDEVWLQIVRDTPTGAVLSSDYAEHRVNERKFRRLTTSPFHAAMLISDAAACGLDDGWQ